MRASARPAANAFKAMLLLGGFAASLAALGWWLGGLAAAGLFLSVGLFMVATVSWYGHRVLLSSLGARELLLAEAPVVHSAVERLAMVAGVERPRLYVLEDGHPRALVAGRGAGSAAIALSQGLMQALPPAELEGVLAHALARLRNRDVVAETPAVLVAGWLLEVSRIGGFLERALLFALGPIASSVVHLLVSERRIFAADAAAAEICGTPHGLADALVRLEQAQELVAFEGSPVTAPLYVVNPFLEEEIAALFDTHPAVGDRVQRLRDLDPDWREKLRAA